MDELIFEKGVAFGLTPFETIYFYDNKAQYVREHYTRLRRACKVFDIRIDSSYQLSAFEALVVDTIQTHYSIHGGSSGAMKLVPFNGGFVANVRAAAYDASMYERGLRLVLSKAVRDRYNILSYFKTFNYGTNMIEDQRAKRRGFDSSLHLNQNGKVCESAFANIFFVRDKVLYTPKITNGILDGILRKKIFHAATELGYSLEKTEIDVVDISKFDECFITNSVAGVFPVTAIEDCKFYNRCFVTCINQADEFARPWNRMEG